MKTGSSTGRATTRKTVRAKGAPANDQFNWPFACSAIRDDDDRLRRERHREALGRAAQGREDGGGRVLRPGRPGEDAAEGATDRKPSDSRAPEKITIEIFRP